MTYKGNTNPKPKDAPTEPGGGQGQEKTEAAKALLEKENAGLLEIKEKLVEYTTSQDEKIIDLQEQRDGLRAELAAERALADGLANALEWSSDAAENLPGDIACQHNDVALPVLEAYHKARGGA